MRHRGPVEAALLALCSGEEVDAWVLHRLWQRKKAIESKSAVWPTLWFAFHRRNPNSLRKSPRKDLHQLAGALDAKLAIEAIAGIGK